MLFVPCQLAGFEPFRALSICTQFQNPVNPPILLFDWPIKVPDPERDEWDGNTIDGPCVPKRDGFCLSPVFVGASDCAVSD
jgi:hypothetical protein